MCAAAASGEKFPVESAQKRAENLWRRNSSPLGVRNRSRPACKKRAVCQSKFIAPGNER
jgi:hypothetical protein